MQVIDVVSVAGSLVILGTVLWLTATARLKPRYALLWIAASAGLLAVSLFRKTLIDGVGEAFGIAYKPALLFLAADVFLMAILLHMSVVVSRLTERTRVLAEELAVLRGCLDEQGAEQGAGRGEGPCAARGAEPGELGARDRAD